MASKGNGNDDEPGAFPAREWLRQMVVGKMVSFEVRKQGASAGDRVYGLLSVTPPGGTPDQTISLAQEAIRNGFATPRMTPTADGTAETTDNGIEGGTEEERRGLQRIYTRSAPQSSRWPLRHLLAI